MINVYYQTHINYVGGVETFIYELARLAFKEHRDLTIMYKTGDAKQIRRLRKYCRCVPLSKQPKPIKCERVFFNYGLDAIDDFEANEYIQLIHADFRDKSLKGYPLIQSDKITKYYAVSELVAESYRAITGRTDVEVLYNPISLDDEKKIMTLVTAQRMTVEKGVERLEAFAKELDAKHIPYVWHIFSDTHLSYKSENIMYHSPTLDIRKWIKHADYFVILSDTEAYCYGIVESLSLGTPVITTRLGILNEINVNDTNAIILDFDLSNLNVYEIYDKLGTFNIDYKPKKTKWLNVLQGESDYMPPKYVDILALQKYIDVEEDREIKPGEIYDVREERADKIVGLGYAEVIIKE